jgi:hypothetical protein
MMRSALALVFAVVLPLAGCGGKHAGDTTPGAGSGPSPVAKQISLAWGITQAASAADVFLQITDETGHQTSYPLGNYGGQCKVITPAAEMKAVSGVGCTGGASSVELHAVVSEQTSNSLIVVVKLRLEPGVKPDPMAREEVTHVPTPSGAKVVVGS